MKTPLLTLLFASLLFGSAGLPIIKYDPFYKAQKILKKPKKKHFTLERKRELQLTAIYNQKACINGRFYKRGDKVYEYKVAKVLPKAVVLQKGNSMRVIHLINKSGYIKTKDLESEQ